MDACRCNLHDIEHNTEDNKHKVQPVALTVLLSSLHLGDASCGQTAHQQTAFF